MDCAKPDFVKSNSLRGFQAEELFQVHLSVTPAARIMRELEGMESQIHAVDGEIARIEGLFVSPDFTKPQRPAGRHLCSCPTKMYSSSVRSEICRPDGA